MKIFVITLLSAAMLAQAFAGITIVGASPPLELDSVSSIVPSDRQTRQAGVLVPILKVGATAIVSAGGTAAGQKIGEKVVQKLPEVGKNIRNGVSSVMDKIKG